MPVVDNPEYRIKISIDSKTSDKEMDAIKKKTQELTGGFSSLQKGVILFSQSLQAISIVSGAVSSVFNSMAKASHFFIEEASGSEQFRISIENLTGSARKADVVLNNLAEFAERAPFDMPDLESTAKKLISFGISTDKLIPTMETLGKASAGTGSSIDNLAVIYGKMTSNGIVSTRELQQLMLSGIPIMDTLAKNLNKSTFEIVNMAEKGNLSITDIDNAFDTLTKSGGKFADSMSKQSNSIQGYFVRLRNVIREFGAAIGDEMLPSVKEAVNEIINFIKTNDQLIRQDMASIFRTAAGAALSLLQLLKEMSPFLNAILEIINRNILAFGGSVSRIQMLKMEIGDLEKSIERLSTEANKSDGIWTKITKSLTNAQRSSSGITDEVNRQIESQKRALALLREEYERLTKANKEFNKENAKTPPGTKPGRPISDEDRRTLEGYENDVKNLAAVTNDAFKSPYQNLRSISQATISDLNAFKSKLDAMGVFEGEEGASLRERVGDVIDKNTDYAEQIILEGRYDLISRVSGEIGNITNSMVSFLQDVADVFEDSALVDSFSSQAISFIQDQMLGVGGMVGAGIGLFSSMIDILQRVVDFFPSLFEKLAKLIDSITDFPQKMNEAIDKFFKASNRFFGEALTKFFDKLREFFRMATTRMEELSDAFDKQAQELPKAFERFIDDMPEIAERFGKLIATALPRFIRSFLYLLIKGIPQMMRVMAKTMPIVVEAFIEGFKEGLKEAGKILSDAFKGKFDFSVDEAQMQNMSDLVQKSASQLFEVKNLDAEARGLDVASRIRASIEEGTKRSAKLWEHIWGMLKGIVQRAFQWVKDNIITPLNNIGKKAFQWVKENVVDRLNNIGKNSFSKLHESMKGLMRTPEWIKEFSKIVNRLRDALGTVKDAGSGKDVKGKVKFPKFEHGGIVKKFANGGYVKPVYAQNGLFVPSGTDTVPAMLTPGEFVINRDATKANFDLLKSINSGSLPMSGGQTVINVTINAKTDLDQASIRTELMPEIINQLKSRSQRGEFILASTGIRSNK